jgi:hypothetical protein
MLVGRMLDAHIDDLCDRVMTKFHVYHCGDDISDKLCASNIPLGTFLLLCAGRC